MMPTISREGKCAICVSWYFDMCEGNSKARAAQIDTEDPGCTEFSAGSEFQSVGTDHPF